MQNASAPSDLFEHVLGRLPPGLDLDALATETMAIERRREITSGGDLLRLALARGPGRMSLSQTAAWAGRRVLSAGKPLIALNKITRLITLKPIRH